MALRQSRRRLLPITPCHCSTCRKRIQLVFVPKSMLSMRLSISSDRRLDDAAGAIDPTSGNNLNSPQILGVANQLNREPLSCWFGRALYPRRCGFLGERI